jgi:hypothetical protein
MLTKFCFCDDLVLFAEPKAALLQVTMFLCLSFQFDCIQHHRSRPASTKILRAAFNLR